MKLEVYNKNFNKLLKYAESSAICVVYAKRNAEAQWQKNIKTITINNNNYGTVQELAFFLHELGHVRDDYTLGLNKELDKAYLQFNKMISKTIKNTTNKNKMLVIDTEFRAWNYGINIAKHWYRDWETRQGIEIIELTKELCDNDR